MYCNRKAAQVAGYLLNKAGGSEYYILVLKLMYIADRRFLNEKGRAITNDEYCSMDNGPVLSKTYNLMKGATSDDSYDGWLNWISRSSGYKITLLKKIEDNYDFDELSRAEMAMLDSVFDEYAHWNRFDLCEETHKFGEWRNPHGSSRPIDLREVFTAQGRDEQTAEYIIADIIARKQIAEMLVDPSERA